MPRLWKIAALASAVAALFGWPFVTLIADDCATAIWADEIVVGLALSALGISLVLLDPQRGWWLTRTLSLTLATLLVLIVSSTRPISIDEVKLQYAEPLPAGANRELVEIELAKANEEIRVRIQQEDTWFHYKFLLIGTLLAGFGGLFGLRRREGGDPDLVETALSPGTCSILALACVVALSIDIHLRNNIVVIQQLGLWIARYAEPALMPAAAGGFIPWERFLRTPDAGMHSDDVYGFIFYPHLHFLTWVLYVLYLGCFQTLAQRAYRKDVGPQPYALLAAGFVIVHFAFAAFAWVGHFLPAAFQTDLHPFSACPRTGIAAAMPFLLAALLLIPVNGPYFFKVVQLAWRER